MIKIREANEADLKNIAEVVVICFSNDFGDKNIALNWIKERFNLRTFSRYHISEMDGKVVGYIYNKMLGGTSGILELEQIGIDPEYQGKGIGKMLILESEKFWKNYLKNKFNKKMHKFLLTTAKINDKAHNLYAKCGFKYECTMKNLYYGNDEEIWIKTY